MKADMLSFSVTKCCEYGM